MSASSGDELIEAIRTPAEDYKYLVRKEMLENLKRQNNLPGALSSRYGDAGWKRYVFAPMEAGGGLTLNFATGRRVHQPNQKMQFVPEPHLTHKMQKPVVTLRVKAATSIPANYDPIPLLGGQAIVFSVKKRVKLFNLDDDKLTPPQMISNFSATIFYKIKRSYYYAEDEDAAEVISIADLQKGLSIDAGKNLTKLFKQTGDTPIVTYAIPSSQSTYYVDRLSGPVTATVEFTFEDEKWLALTNKSETQFLGFCRAENLVQVTSDEENEEELDNDYDDPDKNLQPIRSQVVKAVAQIDTEFVKYVIYGTVKAATSFYLIDTATGVSFFKLFNSAIYDDRTEAVVDNPGENFILSIFGYAVSTLAGFVRFGYRLLSNRVYGEKWRYIIGSLLGLGMSLCSIVAAIKNPATGILSYKTIQAGTSAITAALAGLSQFSSLEELLADLRAAATAFAESESIQGAENWYQEKQSWNAMFTSLISSISGQSQAPVFQGKGWNATFKFLLSIIYIISAYASFFGLQFPSTTVNPWKAGQFAVNNAMSALSKAQSIPAEAQRAIFARLPEIQEGYSLNAALPTGAKNGTVQQLYNLKIWLQNHPVNSATTYQDWLNRLKSLYNSHPDIEGARFALNERSLPTKPGLRQEEQSEIATFTFPPQQYLTSEAVFKTWLSSNPDSTHQIHKRVYNSNNLWMALPSPSRADVKRFIGNEDTLPLCVVQG